MMMSKRSIGIYRAWRRYVINGKTMITYQNKLQYKLQIRRMIRNILITNISKLVKQGKNMLNKLLKSEIA